MQNRELLNKWKNKLLDTGKRNNLINFRNTKLGSVDVIYPNFSTIFSNVEHGKTFEVYDTKNDVDEVREYLADLVARGRETTFDTFVRTSRDEYVREHTRTFKPNQVLLFNSMVNPILTLRNIARNGRSAIEETGVNIVYMAFGFLNWAEKSAPNDKMKAPLLLVAVSIENASALKPYYIKVIDTEVVVNPALAYKLKMDYNIDIPQYDEESGEDINVYLAKLEELFLPLGWKIDRDCKLSTFSFLKINMYRDLQDNESKVLENESIQAILDTASGEDIGDGLEEIPSEDSSDALSPIPLHNVVDADSSQNEAVTMAATGKSFVLQGPPGTGKSQTITNIIAECLSQGKRVLFVSEKLAALQVVYEKLRRVGLEEFCLELHSHKSNKKAVIEELNATLRKGKSTLRDDTVSQVTAEYDKAMSELDEYVDELHVGRPVINKSLYSIFDEIAAYRNVPTLSFVIDNIKEKGEEFLRHADACLARYCEFTPSIGYDYHANCWYGYAEPDGTYAARMGVKGDLSNTIILLRNLAAVNRQISENYQIYGINLRQMYILRDFFRLISKSDFVTPSLLNATIYEIIELVEELKVIAGERNALKSQIDEVFDEDVYSYDGELIYKKLTRQFNSFGSRMFSKEYRELVKTLRLYKKDGKRVKYDFAVKLFSMLQDCQQKENLFTEKEYEIKDILGSGYVRFDTDFDRLLVELNELARILADGVDLGNIRCMTEESYYEEKEHFGVALAEFERAFSLREESENKLFASFNVNECDIREMSLDELEDKLMKCFENIEVLDNWCRFYKHLCEMSTIGLRDFVDLAIENEVRVEDITSSYRKVFLWQWADTIIVESERLNHLLRQWHDDRVNKFKRDDLILFEINKAIIKSTLSQKRPDLDLIASGSAVAVLQREGEKKSKHMSIRRLLNEIGELVQTLKPCFLMSPLSVSTFLSPDIQFDVVIFDEASQIFPQDALGAIYRGKQLIVVGDEKQMPPSNFFNAISIGEEDEETEATDFESILNLCAAHFPERCLKWHYRSRHEQLIAFSNKYFYNNELITFPSARCKTQGLGVDFCKVDGLFDHTTRTNRVEAEKVADLVFEHIERYPDRSLGVVAFSISQQNLIDRIILQRRRSDPSKEAFFTLDKEEPFFVKNLETVQGDERDTIIFSVAYGKDRDGRVLANFGPINKEGGGRRLNVAVTRAKENVVVVSSMSYTDLNLANSTSQGAKLLKAYLDFAENGMPALERLEESSPYEGYNSELENEVADFLRENGYEVECQVGCSALKVDLALKKPDGGDYVLAIECDGRVYRSSRSTRDRDRLRQQVLERMGWKYYRVWSTDWFRNKDNEKRRLLEAVRQAFDEVVELSDDILEELGEIDDSFVEEVVEEHFDFPLYVNADVLGIIRSARSNKMRVIKRIVEIESPISSEWLLNRISFMFGTSLTAAVRREYESLLVANCEAFAIKRRDGFLFNNEVSYPMLRIPDGEYKRSVDHIPLEELANGLEKVIELNVTIAKEDLFSYIRARLGFRSLTERIRFRLERALQLLIDSGKVLVDEDKLSLREDS